MGFSGTYTVRSGPAIVRQQDMRDWPLKKDDKGLRDGLRISPERAHKKPIIIPPLRDSDSFLVSISILMSPLSGWGFEFYP